ncbi:MAG: hypothetical protein GEU73_03095 [Chloroflexi bacterium]|nr:hypothetical protein [Chloroflexota bacterium]
MAEPETGGQSGIPASPSDTALRIASRAETPLDIGRSAAEIYAYLADFTRHHEWFHTYLSVEALDVGSPRVGSRFRVQQKQDLRWDKLAFTTIADREGFDFTSEMQVTALEPSRHVAWHTEAETGPFSGNWEFRLDAITERITTVRLRGHLTSPSAAIAELIDTLQRLGYPLDVVQRQVDRAMHNVRTILEGRVRHPGGTV